MNKRELIKELIDIGGCDATDEWSKGYDEAIGNAIHLAEQLNEPELPVIPQFVADCIKDVQDNRRHITILNVFDEVNRCGFANERVDSWIENNSDLFTEAWLAYPNFEIEKEKKWVVKIGKGYFAGFNELIATFVVNDLIGADKDILKFQNKNKNKAETLANDIGGTVEEWNE